MLRHLQPLSFRGGGNADLAACCLVAVGWGPSALRNLDSPHPNPSPEGEGLDVPKPNRLQENRRRPAKTGAT
ncbi:protein of unknown function [uncultured Sphingopyxis sp.]|uniref:Uncharacterized protein n=1 Tax=uncultured Sphingopyxis sp. TaxID=310581 RepID=A0A1Y5PNF9_9SPHN|nr:protein of unknown function [uncultured Sphingopyxis sp.]